MGVSEEKLEILEKRNQRIVVLRNQGLKFKVISQRIGVTETYAREVYRRLTTPSK